MIQHFDLSLFHLVNGWCGNWALDRIVGFEERTPLFKGGVFLTVYWWFWFAGGAERRAASRERIITALIAVVATLVVNRALACALPFRVRPMYVPDIGYHAPSFHVPMDLEHWSSFPSDTATFFIALACGVFLLSRPLGAILTAYAAVWICLPRLYLGIHYPSDLIAGAVLGGVGVWAVHAAMQARDGALARRIMAPVTTLERRKPQWFYAIAFVVTFEMTVIFDDLRSLVRSVLHGLHHGGYLGVGEGAAMFAIGGAALALALLAGFGITWWRRHGPSHGRTRMPAGTSPGE